MRKPDESMERRRAGYSLTRTIDLYRKGEFGKLMPLVSRIVDRAGGISGAEGAVRKARQILFRDSAVLERLICRITEEDPRAFADAWAEFFKAMVRPSMLEVYMRKGSERYRGLMTIGRQNGHATIEANRAEISIEDEFVARLAVEYNRVYYFSNGRAYWAARSGDSTFVGVESVRMERGEPSVMVAPFERGLVRAYGDDLTFGGALYPAKATVKATALFTRVVDSNQEARTDELTGLTSRREFYRVLRYFARNFFENGEDTAIVMGDIDHFKSFNDTFGHDAGDRVLVATAEKATESFRQSDVVAAPAHIGSETTMREQPVYRLGGEELMVILAGADVAGGVIAAERYRQMMEGTSLHDESGAPLRRITVSMGVAAVSQADWALRNRLVSPARGLRDGFSRLSMEEKIAAVTEVLPKIADKALYTAKERRNSVALAVCRGSGGAAALDYLSHEAQQPI
jgi:diguanylate cyclase (GGDEF)-like protein